MRTGWPQINNSPPASFGVAEDGVRQFAASGADQAIQSEDFAMTKGERNLLVTARGREVPRFEHDARRVDLPLGNLGDPFGAADHKRDKRLARHVRHRRAYGDILAVAQDRDAVGDGEDLLQLVADKNDRDAVDRAAFRGA